jgi:hypothetical protein
MTCPDHLRHRLVICVIRQPRGLSGWVTCEWHSVHSSLKLDCR